MGMYWQTILYFGRMLSPEAKQRLADVDDTDRFLTKVAENRWILHAPNKKITMGNIDPILEDQEKHQGFVTFKAIDEWLKEKGLEAKWGAVTQEELARLDELVIAAGHDVDVLADLSLRSEDHMQCSGEDHRQQQGEERRSFHTELHRARVKCERQITRAAFVSHLGGPEVEALSN